MGLFSDMWGGLSGSKPGLPNLPAPSVAPSYRPGSAQSLYRPDLVRTNPDPGRTNQVAASMYGGMGGGFAAGLGASAPAPPQSWGMQMQGRWDEMQSDPFRQQAPTALEKFNARYDARQKRRRSPKSNMRNTKGTINTGFKGTEQGRGLLGGTGRIGALKGPINRFIGIGGTNTSFVPAKGGEPLFSIRGGGGGGGANAKVDQARKDALAEWQEGKEALAKQQDQAGLINKLVAAMSGQAISLPQALTAAAEGRAGWQGGQQQALRAVLAAGGRAGSASLAAPGGALAAGMRDLSQRGFQMQQQAQLAARQGIPIKNLQAQLQASGQLGTALAQRQQAAQPFGLAKAKFYGGQEGAPGIVI